MRKITVLFFVLVQCVLLQAQNTLKIGQYQVLPNTNFEIQLIAENTDPFVAFQVDIPIPTGFSYVDGSAALNASRTSGHALTASLLTGNILRLIGYSVGNVTFLGNSGALVSFTLKSGASPTSYALELNQPMLGNSQSVNIITGSSNGSVTVLAPNIAFSTSILDFGRVPLGSSVEQYIEITNSGSTNLIINGLAFSDSQFTTITPTSFTITPNNSRSIVVKFAPISKGTPTKQLQISSNDPDQSTMTIALNAIAYAVNEIHTSNIGGASSTTKTLEFSLNNMENFSGFQFDLNLPQPLSYKTGTAQLFRKQDHAVSVNQIDNQTLRVVCFSAGGKNFTGNNGKVLSLDFLLYGNAGYYSIGISNVIIANTAGENIVSDSYGAQLEVTCPYISTSSQLVFGDVSILSSSTLPHRIYNYGQESLTIHQLQFSNTFFKSNQTLPVTIQPYNFFDLPIEFAKNIEGTTNGTLKIFSNDPANTPFSVQLNGNAFIPNYLLIKTQNYLRGENKTVAIEVENEEPFVALQFDLSYPSGFTPDVNAIALTNRKQDHVLSAIALSNTSLRILVFSPGQKPITGKTGPILNIPFKAETNLSFGTYDLNFSNALISDIKSENILYETKNGVLNIKPNKILNIWALLEGLYNGNGTMRQAYDDVGQHWDTGIADYITVELHNSTIVYTATNVALSTAGLATIAVPGTFNGNYYITIKHRNSIQTTSASAVSFETNTINQSFLTPATVFGGNLQLMIDGRYTIFAGDVNQDGTIDSNDMIPVDNDSSNYLYGYITTDVNGDGAIDSNDMIIIDNNNANYIGSVQP